MLLRHFELSTGAGEWGCRLQGLSPHAAQLHSSTGPCAAPEAQTAEYEGPPGKRAAWKAGGSWVEGSSAPRRTAQPGIGPTSQRHPTGSPKGRGRGDESRRRNDGAVAPLPPGLSKDVTAGPSHSRPSKWPTPVDSGGSARSLALECVQKPVIHLFFSYRPHFFMAFNHHS